jgi:hypothetical protein
MSARARVMISVVVLAAMVTWRYARAIEETPVRLIRYTNDALTVRLTSVPVAEILEEVGKQSGAEIRGQVREPREVTADFQSVPLSEALSRLLGDQNFALVYGRGGRLKAVRLLGGSDLLAQPRATPPPTVPVAASPPPFPVALLEILDRHPPVPIAGVLADALGSRTATFRQLFDLSLHHEDADVRTEALRTGIATIEGEPELSSAVISELTKADSALLTTLVRASASDQAAQDAAAQVLHESRAPEIRLKASSFLQRLIGG